MTPVSSDDSVLAVSKLSSVLLPESYPRPYINITLDAK